MRTRVPALATLAGLCVAATIIGISLQVAAGVAGATATGPTSRPAVNPQADEARASVALRLLVAAAKAARATGVVGTARTAFRGSVALAEIVRAGDFGTAVRKLRDAADVLVRVADANVDVAFYGRVVDQDGNPVPGHRVEAVVQQLSLDALVGFGTVPAPYRVYNLSTDNNGGFEVHGWGTSLLVNREQEGFASSPRDPSTFTYDATNGNPFRPDPARPIVFHVTRQVPGEEQDGQR